MSNEMNDNEHKSDQHKPDSAHKPSLLQVAQSVLAAVFGVQSAQNRERDFKKGQPGDYIAIYVIIVITMVVGMIITVNMVLASAGK